MSTKNWTSRPPPKLSQETAFRSSRQIMRTTLFPPMSPRRMLTFRVPPRNPLESRSRLYFPKLQRQANQHLKDLLDMIGLILKLWLPSKLQSIHRRNQVYQQLDKEGK